VLGFVFPLDGKMVRPICFVLLCLLPESCAKPSAHEPVTLTFVEEWSNKTFSEARQLAGFTSTLPRFCGKSA
jgi:hypothetical protein